MLLTLFLDLIAHYDKFKAAMSGTYLRHASTLVDFSPRYRRTISSRGGKVGLTKMTRDLGVTNPISSRRTKKDHYHKLY